MKPRILRIKQPPRVSALEWLLNLASGSVGYPARIESYIARADWKGLMDWLDTVAAPAVFTEFQERGWPPPPKIYHGLMPKLTTADLVRGKPLWRSLEIEAAEQAAKEAKRLHDLEHFELVEIPEAEY